MNRAARTGLAVAAVGLVAAGGFALPSTRAQLSDAARSAASVFTAGDWSGDGALPGDLPGDLADMARRAACAAEPATAACGATPPAGDSPVPPWLAELRAGTPATPPPGSPPSPAPERPVATEQEREELPVEGESCVDERCVQAAITVVDRFVTGLEEDERAPQDAVAALRDFVDEATDQEQSEDVPLTDAVRDALGALIESGSAPPLTPECLVTLGELAAQLAGDPADAEARPSPCPSASDTAPPAPTPSGSPSPQPTPSRSEVDTDGDGETDTIYDKPGRPYGEGDDER